MQLLSLMQRVGEETDQSIRCTVNLEARFCLRIAPAYICCIRTIEETTMKSSYTQRLESDSGSVRCVHFRQSSSSILDKSSSNSSSSRSITAFYLAVCAIMKLSRHQQVVFSRITACIQRQKFRGPHQSSRKRKSGFEDKESEWRLHLAHSL